MRFEDDALRPGVDELVVIADQPRRPIGEMHYAIEGHGPHTVLEEGDRMAAGLSAGDAVEAVAERCRARVLDHLSVGGWTVAWGGIVGVDGQRVLVVGDADGAYIGHARAAGWPVEGDDLVVFRGREAVCLPQPSSTTDITAGAVTSVVVVGRGDGPRVPLNTGQVVEALVAVTVRSWKPPADVLRACVELVGGADGYRVPAPS